MIHGLLSCFQFNPLPLGIRIIQSDRAEMPGLLGKVSRRGEGLLLLCSTPEISLSPFHICLGLKRYLNTCSKIYSQKTHIAYVQSMGDEHVLCIRLCALGKMMPSRS